MDDGAASIVRRLVGCPCRSCGCGSRGVADVCVMIEGQEGWGEKRRRAAMPCTAMQLAATGRDFHIAVDAGSTA